MNSTMNSPLSSVALRRIDAACDQYEAAWREGRQPQIEDYLQLCELDERPQLLESLGKLQQELILSKLSSEVKVAAPQAPVEPKSPPVEVPSAVAEPPEILEESADRTQIWNPPRVTLKVIAGPHEGQEFIYDEHDTLLVGRSIHAQLRLKEDVHFSRHHFRLEANPPSCFVMDLGSRNGTFVNGERITERFLKDGDVLSGGRTKMSVSIHDPLRLNQAHAQSPAVRLPKPEPVHRPPVAQPLKQLPYPTSPPRPMLLAGSKEIHIQGYAVHEQLGKGDLGTVYRATRLATGENCAMKVISPAGRADERAIQTFLREASLLNQLHHQYIVRLIEMGSSGSDLYLCTEYIPAIPWERLSAGWTPQQRIRVACAIMGQILGALDFAHSRSMVHRDVKPGNILISRPEGKLLGKLADFGLAKHYTTAGMSQMTREGDVIGSLPFMSPEQFINSREARPACDLYSAGATLYWMLSGHEPIVLENHPCKFLAILEDAPVPLQTRCPDVPAELAQIVHRALEKSPDKRFSSAAEMRQYVRKFAK